MSGLVGQAEKLLSDNALFFLLNTYTTGLSPMTMRYIADLSIKPRHGGHTEAGELCLPVRQTGSLLPCGGSVRWEADGTERRATGWRTGNGKRRAFFIEIKDLSYAYPGEEGRGQQVLSHQSTIREGEYTVILGHNGSGKSTLAKLINLVIDDYTYAEGQILVGGRDVMADDHRGRPCWSCAEQVGMVFRNPDNQLVATIVEEDVAFGPENLGIPNPELRERVDAALATVGMSEYAHHEPHRLSGGQKQRVAIAGIIAMKPRCMIR